MSAGQGPLVLGLDIGTGSTKAVLCRPDGVVLSTAAREHRTSTPRPGHVEMDAEGQWWAEVGDLAHELLADVPGARTRREVTPDPGAHDAYRQLAPLFDDLYPATRDVVHALSERAG